MVTLMPSQWSCYLDNIQSGRHHSFVTCSAATFLDSISDPNPRRIVSLRSCTAKKTSRLRGMPSRYRPTCLFVVSRCLGMDSSPNFRQDRLRSMLMQCTRVEANWLFDRRIRTFQGAQLDSPLLHHVTLIDTPGILSGEKQRIGRSYDFTQVRVASRSRSSQHPRGCCQAHLRPHQVIEWFAARADVILLLFDAHKLDISDEFRHAIEALKGHDDKIRVVLNKVRVGQGLHSFASQILLLSVLLAAPRRLIGSTPKPCCVCMER